MIKPRGGGHVACEVTVAPLAARSLYANLSQAPDPVEQTARLHVLLRANFDAMWRLLRRLGVSEGDLDDAVQEVVVVLARKLDEIESGSERAFTLSTAYRVASTWRRARRRRPEMVDVDAQGIVDPTASSDELLDRQRARALLDRVLDGLPLDLRAVFVLYELERLTMAEIAQALELPPGTVASRLRRARAAFESKVQELEARHKESIHE